MENVVGAFEAKTHLSKILQQVREGQEFVFAVRGEKVARIIPYAPQSQQLDKQPLRNVLPPERLLQHQQAIERILCRKPVPLNGITIRELIEDGRKY